MNSETGIRNEELLLMGLCRLEFTADQVAKICDLKGSVTDWEYFRNLAGIHGVAALVYYNLDKHDLLNNIPDEIITFLRMASMRSMSRNAFNSEVIGSVLQLLNNENIKTVLLKGLALEISVYGNSGLRQMTDVDILIDHGSCLKARRILMNNGFISHPVKSVFHSIIMEHTGKHLPTLMKKGTSVEIHHELFGANKRILTGKLYENSYETEIKGEKVFIPQPQIFFLYLVRHLYLHERNNESQLRLYTDLVVMLDKHFDEIINNELLVYASEAHMTEILARRLQPLRDHWRISFPVWINEFIDKWCNPYSTDKFIFFLKSPKNNPLLNRGRVYRETISDIPGIHRKFLFLLGDIFPSFSFMKKRYNCAGTLKLLLYYPLRMGKILWLIRR
jgi:hypothetical protein